MSPYGFLTSMDSRSMPINPSRNKWAPTLQLMRRTSNAIRNVPQAAP